MEKIVYIPEIYCPKEFQGLYQYGCNFEDGTVGYNVPLSVWEDTLRKYNQQISQTVSLQCSHSPSSATAVICSTLSKER